MEENNNNNDEKKNINTISGIESNQEHLKFIGEVIKKLTDSQSDTIKLSQVTNIADEGINNTGNSN